MRVIPKPIRRGVERFMTERVGKAVYGNLAGYRNNREGERRLRRARTSPIVVDSRADELRANGCGFYSGLDQDCLRVVREKYCRKIEDPDFSIPKNADQRPAQEGEEVYQVPLRDTAGTIPEVLDLIDAGLQDYLRSYFLGEFRIHSILAWRIFHVPPEVLERHTPFALKWHNDAHTTDTLKLFVALSDIGEDDGPFHFVTKNRTKEIMRSGFRNRHDYGAAESMVEENVNRMTGPAGTVALCNTTTNLHRAGIPAKGRKRDILQYRLESSLAPFDPHQPLEDIRLYRS